MIVPFDTPCACNPLVRDARILVDSISPRFNIAQLNDNGNPNYQDYLLSIINSQTQTIRSLEQEVKEIREKTEFAVELYKCALAQKRRLRVLLSKRISERKPFHMRVEGYTTFSINLSLIRTALLIALLAELQVRTHGSYVLTDFETRINNVLAFLGHRPRENTNIKCNISAALFRLGIYLSDEKPFDMDSIRWRLAKGEPRIEIRELSDPKQIADMVVTVDSQDKVIQRSIAYASNTRP